MDGVAEVVARADPLQLGDPLGQKAAAADQIGAAQRQLGVAGAQLGDAPQDPIEIGEIALLHGAEAESADHPVVHGSAPRRWWPIGQLGRWWPIGQLGRWWPIGQLGRWWSIGQLATMSLDRT
jgi:hypothetical protein